jgi:tRNA modification GTPase
VVVKRRADLVEVHCHGGLAASRAVIASLVAGSARDVPWTEWLRLAGANQIEVEAHAALARAGGPRAAQILTRQLAGALHDAFARLTACIAAGDHAAADTLRARLHRAARVGLRLDRPWRVVLAGPVNAGKSSLVNALAGHARSLVSPEAGTTRDLVETRLVLGGWEVDLVDTAGLRDATALDGPAPAVAAVEQEGIARGLAAQAEADLVLRIMPADAARPPTVAANPAELLVMTKCDLATAAGPPPAAFPHDVIRTSAVTGSGIDLLADRIVAALVPEELTDPTLLDGAVPFTPRQLAALRPSDA